VLGTSFPQLTLTIFLSITISYPHNYSPLHHTSLPAMRFFTTTSLRCPRLLPLNTIRQIARLSTTSEKKAQGRPKKHIKAESSEILKARFSRVKFNEIAPKVGLMSLWIELSDARRFDVHRARLPNDTFVGIADDLRVACGCYGPLGELTMGIKAKYNILPSVSPSFLLYYQLGS
jgi:hypothetical protein